MARDEAPRKLSVEEYERRKQIGATIKRIRERKALTIEQCAVLAGVKYNTWQRWEAGKTAIPLELVANICKALGSVVPQLHPHLRAA